MQKQRKIKRIHLKKASACITFCIWHCKYWVSIAEIRRGLQEEKLGLVAYYLLLLLFISKSYLKLYEMTF